jgi:hypothetical protein
MTKVGLVSKVIAVGLALSSVGCTGTLDNGIGLDWYGGVGVRTRTTVAGRPGYYPPTDPITPPKTGLTRPQSRRGYDPNNTVPYNAVPIRTMVAPAVLERKRRGSKYKMNYKG